MTGIDDYYVNILDTSKESLLWDAPSPPSYNWAGLNELTLTNGL